MVYTLIDHRNDTIKCSKLCSETTRLRLVVPLEFGLYECRPWEIVVDLFFTITTYFSRADWLIVMINKRTDMQRTGT